MSNYKKILKELIIESIKEDTEYQKLVKRVLDMAGVESPQDLSKDQRAKFFAYLDGIWDTEKSAPREEPSQADVDEFITEMDESRDKEYDKFFRKTLRTFGVHSPDELSKDEKKDFFDFIDQNWDAKNESVIFESDVPDKIEVVDERVAAGYVIVMMRDPKSQTMNSAVLSKKANKKYNRNKQEDLKTLWKLGKKYGKSPIKESINEGKLPRQLELIKKKFLTHILKYGKVGSIGVELTDKLDIVLYGPKPHHKDSGKYKHTDPALFIVIEDSRNKRVVQTDIVEFKSFDKKEIEKALDTALDQIYRKTSSKTISNESVKESKIRKVVRKIVREEFIGEEDYDRDKDAQAMGYRNAKEADKDNWGRPVKEAIEDYERGDTAHVEKENKTGMVLKQYGQKVHLKFPNGKEKTYNTSELRKIQSDNINESYRDGSEIVTAYLKGEIDMKKLKKFADNMGTGIAKKSELESLLKNKFLRGMMADTHNVSEKDIQKKVKELLDNKMYESKSISENDSRDFYNKKVKIKKGHGPDIYTGDVVGMKNGKLKVKTKKGIKLLSPADAEIVEQSISMTNLIEARDEAYYITYYDSQDPFAGDVVKSFNKFDKKKIEGIFHAAVDKYLKNEGDEIEFSKGLNNVIMTVELKDGKKMTQITKGSKTYYKPFRGFKGKG